MAGRTLWVMEDFLTDSGGPIGINGTSSQRILTQLICYPKSPFYLLAITDSRVYIAGFICSVLCC
jgi:hypothetical protein